MDGKNTRLPWWLLVMLQLALAGALLCMFALFHHVIPYRQLRRGGMPEPIAAVARAETTPPTEQPIPLELAAEPQTTPEPAPQTWAERFAAHFSDEIVWEDMSYRSPTMAVTVTKYEHPELLPKGVYFVADIYLSDVEQLQAAFPLNGVTFAQPAAIARDADAVVAVNGDCFVDQRGGFVVRNGELYSQNSTTADICVLYSDGRMEIYEPGEYEPEEIVKDGPWQIWHFGPSLLNDDGSARESFNISDALLITHPRTALGYYEPGHYCFVVVDGRQGFSLGAEMKELAAIMSDLGCTAAYNLDGGASSVMIFRGELVNHPVGDRFPNDLVVAADGKEGAE
ncbi:MAG: phosphodiester glycosidase family protein [Oscillospiraceae bacterium]|nr:phosphodiester glycosidase family protein [Oscillospiraceae bacterium]